MSRSVADIKKDVEEMEMLVSESKRSHVKEILQIELRKLQIELSKLMTEGDETKTKSTVKATPNCPTVSLTNYAWDQSNKYMKIYIDLKNVHHLPKEKITCNFEAKSMNLTVYDLDNRNYRFGVKRLAGTIVPSESFFKIKTDSLVIMMMKQSNTNWEHVTEMAAEKSKEKTKKKPTLDDSKDPSEGIMDILKNIYEEGDDDMKRTINQAWYESRNKTSSFD